ncbi:MAG TPA: hypothetical protein DHU55_06445 [Blastocatellia bacterium]|jgi:hypothetical protein|nr:hypothetical protein [Blastocatellia bacterium]HAF21600.1 hypothetical protein [Blastocatellia bacterium]HCX29399.1 hypothetical protein [Blastocatellia bacterium]
MKDNIEREGWARYLTTFSKRNKSRPTWLQVFGEAGAQSEEQGLPLVGISLEEKGIDAPRVQIMLGGHDAIDPRHLTHMISNVQRVTPQVGTDGRDDAIEFVDKQGEASLLIFKHRA